MSEENSNQPINNAAELQQRYEVGERNFRKANLAEADLRDTDLRGADLQGANLRGANLRGVNLKEAHLKDVSLKESDLRGANLSGANLKGANLSGTSLELAMLHRADLQGANLRGANLSGTMLMGASLERADLTFADFSDTYMIAQGASGGANLEGANLSGANLKGAYLRGANLSGANLKEANLKGAYPQGAYYDGRTHLPGGFDPVSLGMQKLRTSSKKLSSSARSLKLIFIISTVACVAIVLAPVVIFHTWAETNKSKKATSTATTKPETEVSFKANKPAVDPETKIREANKPAVDPETKIREVNEPKPAPTPDVNRRTQAAPATQPAKVISTPGRQVASCPALVRVINAANPDKPSAVDISINGKKAISNVPFGQASRYLSVSPGQFRVQFMKAGTTTIVDKRTFAAAPNSAYSIAVTGSLSGPPGQLLFNKSPFVIPEDLSPPSPGKFKGRWYKLSETKAAMDLRIAKSGTPGVVQARLVDVIPKTAVNYSELKAGTYNFNTVLPKKSDPLVNSAYKPPIRVEIAKAKIPAGTIFDVFAIGNSLGKGHNSLKLSAALYKTLAPTAAGCIKVQ